MSSLAEKPPTETHSMVLPDGWVCLLFPWSLTHPPRAITAGIYMRNTPGGLGWSPRSTWLGSWRCMADSAHSSISLSEAPPSRPHTLPSGASSSPPSSSTASTTPTPQIHSVNHSVVVVVAVAAAEAGLPRGREVLRTSQRHGTHRLVRGWGTVAGKRRADLDLSLW